MLFESQLSEATLLKRTLKFLAEIVMKNNRKMLIRCPNMAEMPGCDILGSRIWYSNSTSEQYLHTWELVEVDGGHLVSINSENINALVIEAISNGIVTELSTYKVLHSKAPYQDHKYIDILLENDKEKCFVGVEHVILGDERGEGFFPAQMASGTKNLKQLIELRQNGQRAVLFFGVMHTGIDSVRPADHIDPLYGKLLRKAVSLGVEVVAYRANINLEGIYLEKRLPVVYSQDKLSLNDPYF